jgi:ribosomal protein L44E
MVEHQVEHQRKRLLMIARKIRDWRFDRKHAGYGTRPHIHADGLLKAVEIAASCR